MITDQEKELATKLHSILCHWNHIDGCGWYYFSEKDGIWEKDEGRMQYTQMARRMQKILKDSSNNSIIDVISSLEKARNDSYPKWDKAQQKYIIED